MNEFDTVNSPEGEEVLARHIAAHMNLSLEEARALVHKHGNDLKKIEEDRARLMKDTVQPDGR